jgi:hypothetical protein
LDQCQKSDCQSLQEAAHAEIRGLIPEAQGDSVESLLIPYGFSLLQEITFNLVVYSAADVQSPTLRGALLQEYREILHSLITSKKVFDEAVGFIESEGRGISSSLLQEYMMLKRKKMNQKMMVLADSIALEEPLPTGMLDYFQHMSEVCELKAVAYKDLQGASQATDPSQLSNNLFYFWLLERKGKQALASPLDLTRSVIMRTEFFQFIETYCRDLMDLKYQLRQSPFFDELGFEETMKLVESYYKLDPQLALLTKRIRHKL